MAGPRRGKDYRVMAGKNFVGRADDMDIQILGDNKISRRNHCVIVYDEKQSKTVLLPGDSNGIVYLNGQKSRKSRFSFSSAAASWAMMRKKKRGPEALGASSRTPGSS